MCKLFSVGIRPTNVVSKRLHIEKDKSVPVTDRELTDDGQAFSLHRQSMDNLC
jgi:hypothetical protein